MSLREHLNIKAVIFGFLVDLVLSFASGFGFGILIGLVLFFKGYPQEQMERFLVNSLTYSGIFLFLSCTSTLIAGCVTAHFSNLDKLKNTFYMGVVTLIVSVIYWGYNFAAHPFWLSLISCLLIIPMALLGGVLKIYWEKTKPTQQKLILNLISKRQLVALFGSTFSFVIFTLFVIGVSLEQSPPREHYNIDVPISISQEPIIGQENAPLTLVEFLDYQCPYCKKFENQTLPELIKKYVDTGKIRLVIFHTPQDYHTQAYLAAQAALCADEQHQYSAMRKFLFDDSDHLSVAAISEEAKTLGLDIEDYANCFVARNLDKLINQDLDLVEALHFIDGIPAFILGKTTKEGVQGKLVLEASDLGNDFPIHLNEVNRE